MIFTLIPDSGFPWSEFAVAMIAGLVSSLIGAAVGVIGSIWAISKTEFYRKASTWEPYAAALWEARLNCFLEISQQIAAFERRATSMVSVADEFTGDLYDREGEHNLKDWFWEEHNAINQATDELFHFVQTKSLLIHPNIETAIVDMFEEMTTFLKVSCSRMQTGLGIPVDLGHDEHPLPSRRQLDDAAHQVKASGRIVLNLMRSELRLFQLDVATVDRFDAMIEQLSPMVMRRLATEVIVKPPKD